MYVQVISILRRISFTDYTQNKGVQETKRGGTRLLWHLILSASKNYELRKKCSEIHIIDVFSRVKDAFQKLSGNVDP